MRRLNSKCKCPIKCPKFPYKGAALIIQILSSGYTFVLYTAVSDVASFEASYIFNSCL